MKRKRIFQMFLVVLALVMCLCVPAFAADGDVAGAVEQTWTDASSQIKTVVDSVVFPALSMILAIAFFAKLAMAYFDYRKHGQFEWAGPVLAIRTFLPSSVLLIATRVGLPLLGSIRLKFETCIGASCLMMPP